MKSKKKKKEGAITKPQAQEAEDDALVRLLTL